MTLVHNNVQMKNNHINAIEQKEHNIYFLSLDDVIQCGGDDILKAADDILEGFHLLSKKMVLQPHKTTLKPLHRQAGNQEGLVNFLPAYVDRGSEELYGVKALGAMPANMEIGLPRASGVIILMDGKTKAPRCLMDAQVISATRTAAVTYLAAKKLANQNVHEIGLVGCGVNMRTQLMAMKLAVPSLKRAYVYSRKDGKHQFAQAMAKKVNMEIIPVNTAKEAVQGKKIILTCLPNIMSPIVKKEWVETQGVTHINIGCYESETSILGHMDRVVADIWEQGKHRGVQTHAQAVKQGVISEDIIEDLAPILTGKVPGRQSENENIFFAPTGLGFEDIVVANRVFKEAMEENIGQKIKLWNNSQWI